MPLTNSQYNALMRVYEEKRAKSRDLANLHYERACQKIPDYIRKWLEDGNFELDLILEACNRTISAIHQPSFEYTDKILENWKTGNVRTLADVERLDSAFEQEKDRRKTPSGQNRTPSAQQPSKFRNFEERSYNMDELTKKLLRSN